MKQLSCVFGAYFHTNVAHYGITMVQTVSMWIFHKAKQTVFVLFPYEGNLLLSSLGNSERQLGKLVLRMLKVKLGP